MYAIEALHPDGWRRQGRSSAEAAAQAEAQMRSSSDGRHYRILLEASGEIVAMVTPACCPLPRPRALAPGSGAVAGQP